MADLRRHEHAAVAALGRAKEEAAGVAAAVAAEQAALAHARKQAAAVAAEMASLGAAKTGLDQQVQTAVRGPSHRVAPTPLPHYPNRPL